MRERGAAFAQTAALTVIAMVAFAANSLLCRLALQRAAIDPVSFGAIRLVSGAIALAVLVRLRAGERKAAAGDWPAALALFAYVACFSLAYRSLAAGAGALILFGAVQLTMFAAGLRHGERFALRAWAGLAVAVGGLAYLLMPGVAAPPAHGALLMAVAGVAWGVYSLRGRGVADPLGATAANFLRAAPLGIVLCLPFVASLHAGFDGVLLALASGAVTSGAGYAIWYTALRGLTALQAATVQLSVPPLAAFGGVLLLAEPVTPRLLLASVAILGGIALVLTAKRKTAQPSQAAPSSQRP